VLRTYQYRLYLSNAQERAATVVLAQARGVYNAALEQRITTYRETGRSVTYQQQWAHFRDLRRANPATLGLLNASSLQHVLRRLDKAYQGTFRRIKVGEKAGFPRFKGANRFHSLEFTYGDGCKLRFEKNGRALLYVQHVGEIKVKFHRLLPKGAVIKHAVLVRKTRKWYVNLQLDLPDPNPRPAEGPAVGIDVGLKNLLALSDGTLVDNPRWLRGSLRKLRVAQRHLARCQKGSRGRQQAAFRVARLHEHVANQRRDFWHKTTAHLVKTYAVIALEDLSLGFMTHNPRLALSAHDAGLAQFRQMLAYKAESAGTQVLTVNPANTSQMCSGCGEMVEKPLSERVHTCPHCGLVLDRDLNAARNILYRALPELKPARTERPGRNVGQWVRRALGSRRL